MEDACKRGKMFRVSNHNPGRDINMIVLEVELKPPVTLCCLPFLHFLDPQLCYSW